VEACCDPTITGEEMTQQVHLNKPFLGRGARALLAFLILSLGLLLALSAATRRDWWAFNLVGVVFVVWALIEFVRLLRRPDKGHQ
jgi:hypothetical protein